MKKILAPLFAILLALTSCSSDDNSSNNSSNENNNNSSDASGYAMTAKINGELFQANNINDTNEHTELGSDFEDFILLVGRKNGPFGNPTISIWLKKTDMVVGTYQIEPEEELDAPANSHFIDLYDHSNDIPNLTDEYTREGSITITEVNTTDKIVKGTFEFTTVDNFETQTTPDFVITEGTFNYKYE